MAIKAMVDNGQAITCSQDGALYNTLANNTDYIIEDIGAEMALTSSDSSLAVTIGTGECVICGRHVTITASETVTVDASTTAYIVLRYDTTKTADNVCYATTTTSLETDNINGSGTVHDICLAQFTSTTSGISNLTDLREIKSAVSRNIYVGTDEPSASLGKDGDIYIQYTL